MSHSKKPAGIWKAVPNYEGLYEVSNKGQIWSTKREKLISTYITNMGYERLYLHRNGEKERYTVHRLMMITFYPQPTYDKMIINHKDGNPLNNTLTNLEWCTYSQNTRHAIQSGLITYKLDSTKAEEIREYYGSQTHSQKELAEMYKVSTSTISKVVNYQVWAF